jgi:hypothetical protein
MVADGGGSHAGVDADEQNPDGWTNPVAERRPYLDGVAIGLPFSTT